MLPIIEGFQVPLKSTHVSFLLGPLLALHRPNAKATITSSVLAEYHENLVHCLMKFAGKQPDLILQIVKQVAGF